MNTGAPKSRFNVRVFSSRNREILKEELKRIGSEPPGVARMLRKAVHYVIKVQGLKTPAVLILKEDMLAKNGDAAIHRDCIIGRTEPSDVLLMGTDKAYAQLISDLHAQPFSLGRLGDEIRQAIDNYNRPSPLMPADDTLPQQLRRFYAAMRERTLVMGILNVTPDSFSDGGLHFDAQTAVEHGIRMVEDGADVIDIGGESSRPGSAPVSAQEEVERVIPVIDSLARQISVPISIDTYKPEVARAALDAGASIINDITGFADPVMRALAAERKCPSIIMHMKGTPQNMQEQAVYDDAVTEIMRYFRERIGQIVDAGLPQEYIIIDPGIGFAKTAEHNLEIIRNLTDFKSIGLPILIGTSRKAFIGKALGDLPPTERLEGTAATVALSINNGANIIRVHDVKEMARVARMTDAIVRGNR